MPRSRGDGFITRVVIYAGDDKFTIRHRTSSIMVIINSLVDTGQAFFFFFFFF